MKNFIKVFFIIITSSFIIISCNSDDDTPPVTVPNIIEAMDDDYTITAEEGVDGITLSNVLDNDVINSIVVNSTNVTITPNTDGPLTVNADGTVMVAENTSAGEYTVTYTLCENGTSSANSNCDDATVTVVINESAFIDAIDDDYIITAEEGVDGITLSNVLDNDVINGMDVNPANVTITPNTDGPLTVNADGTVTVAENTPAGEYTVTYSVCEDGTTPANSNCDDATVTVVVSVPEPVFVFEAGDYDINWNNQWTFKSRLTLSDNTLTGDFCVNNDIDDCENLGPITITRISTNDNDVTFHLFDIICRISPSDPGEFSGDGTIISDNVYRFVVDGEDCNGTVSDRLVIFTKI